MLPLPLETIFFLFEYLSVKEIGKLRLVCFSLKEVADRYFRHKFNINLVLWEKKRSDELLRRDFCVLLQCRLDEETEIKEREIAQIFGFLSEDKDSIQTLKRDLGALNINLQSLYQKIQSVNNQIDNLYEITREWQRKKLTLPYFSHFNNLPGLSLQNEDERKFC